LAIIIKRRNTMNAEIPVLGTSVNEIKFKLELLAQIEESISKQAMEKQALLDSILTEEQKQKIKDIQEEFNPIEKEQETRKQKLESEIIMDVGQLGESVTTDKIQAVYVDGRIKVDTKALMLIAKEHPEIRQTISQGDPYVTIRRIATKKST